MLDAATASVLSLAARQSMSTLVGAEDLRVDIGAEVLNLKSKCDGTLGVSTRPEIDCRRNNRVRLPRGALS